MRRICKTLALSTLAISLTAAPVLAQHHDDHHDDHHDNHHYVHHNDWRKGGRVGHDDWNRGERIDYRHYHLNAPPRGYEWREVDGNYVLAAAATGLISSIIVASSVH
jgi:Ni/Co efflux regulator RcnB